MKTKTWLKRLVGLVLVVHAGVAWAGESPWSLRLGASYRDFDDITFDSSALSNSGTQSNPVGPYGVQNIAAAPGNPIGAPVILDYAQANGSSDGIDSGDKWAPVIGFRYDLTPTSERGLTLALVGNFQYYNLETRSSANGTVAAPGGFAFEQYQHFVLDVAGTLTPGALLVGPAMPGTTFNVRNEFEMDLYVLDLGLEARVTMNRVNLTVALGPSLTIADADSTQSQQASWLAQGPGLPAGNSAGKSSESDTDILFGAYAALGVNLDLSDAWSIGLECRYDYVDRDAGTDQVEMDLSSFSGIVRLAYRY